MSEELLQKYREFVAEIACCYDEELKSKARSLLEESFKEDVIDTWYYDINNRADDFEDITNVEFITHFTYLGKQEEFVENNLNRVPEIISIIKDEIEKRKRVEK